MRKCDLVRFLCKKHTKTEYAKIGINIVELEAGWDNNQVLFKSLSKEVLRAIDEAVITLAKDKKLAYQIAVVRILSIDSEEFKNTTKRLLWESKAILPAEYKAYCNLIPLEIAGGGYVGLGEDSFEVLHNVARNYLVDSWALSQVCSIAYFYNLSVRALFKIARLHFRNVQEEFKKYGYFLVSYPDDKVLLEWKDGRNEERSLLSMADRL